MVGMKLANLAKHISLGLHVTAMLRYPTIFLKLQFERQGMGKLLPKEAAQQSSADKNDRESTDVCKSSGTGASHLGISWPTHSAREHDR